MLRLAGGEALNLILDSLEELEYRWAYRVVDSRAFGLPQRRRRVFILGSRSSDPRSVLLVDNEPEPAELFAPKGLACGFYWTEGLRGLGWAVDAVPTLKGGSTVGIPSPPAVWHPTAGIVTPGIGDAERMQGFTEGWTVPAEKVARASFRWRLVGNAVTANVAEWIGHRLRNPLSYQSDVDDALRGSSRWPDAAYNVGEGRFGCAVGAHPAASAGPSLAEFLDMKAAQPLSRRATAGFLKRFEAGSLRRPDGFIEAVRRHLATMEADAA
jgi:DNA (cytosine-5)-methyltransferase 1